jgi:hypothetical protein
MQAGLSQRWLTLSEIFLLMPVWVTSDKILTTLGYSDAFLALQNVTFMVFDSAMLVSVVNSCLSMAA